MSEYRQLKKQVGALLTGLGSTPDEVAAALRATGAQGTPKSNRTCPVALYLTAVTGADPRVRSVTVGPCSLLIAVASRDLRPAGRLMVQLPKPVRRFVAAFDAREYPANIREPVPSARPSSVSI
jgi:hypothetical protein